MPTKYVRPTLNLKRDGTAHILKKKSKTASTMLKLFTENQQSQYWYISILYESTI